MPQKPVITPRPLQFHFNQSFPKYWFENDPVKTYDINVLALYIPYGEKFFIYSVKAIQDLITNEALKKDIKLFLRQEGFHSREHLQYFKYVIKPHYPKLDINIKPPILLAPIVILLGRKFRLGMTAAGEHYTAVLSDYYLKRQHELKHAPDPIRQMWLWHCVEELEHKAVVFDIMQHIRVGYMTRASSFLLMCLMMFYGYSKALFVMLKQDQSLFSLSFYRKAFRYYFINPGIIRKIAKPFLAYLKPGFHPWQQQNYDLIEPFIKVKSPSFP